MENKERLSWNERIAYCIGCVGLIITFFFISTYFLIFLTDTYGITAMAGGMIITIARIWDAINDPMIGVLADRSRSKWGVYRPWLVRFCIPIAFFTGLCFCAPDFDTTMKTVFIAVIYIIFGMLHTCANMPFGILANVMTQDYAERGVLGAARELGSNFGQLIAQNVGAALLAVFCGSGAYTSIGYMKTAWILGAFSIICLLWCAKNVKERVQPTIEKISYKQSMVALFKNKYALIAGLVAFFFMTFLFFRLTWQSYYCIYYLENPALIAPILTAMNLPPIAILFIAPKIIKKFGKRNTMILGGVIIVISGIVFMAAKNSVPMIFVASVIAGVGQSFPLTAVWAALPDAADWGEVKNGIRSPGIIFTYGTFMVKMGQAITAAFAGGILTLIGYDGLAATQTAEAINGLYMANWIMIIIPGILVIIAAIPYALSEAKYEEVRIKLAEKRANSN